MLNAQKEQVKKLEERLKELGNLPEDFDGYDAPPIPRAVVEVGFEIAEEDLIQHLDPEIFPTGRQTIQFEFRVGDHQVEWEISGRATTHLLVEAETMFTFDCDVESALFVIGQL